MVTQPGDELLFIRLGANDPAFNLRRDPGFILQRSGVTTTTFASILETHGSYTPRDEIPNDPYGNVSEFALVTDTKAYTALRFAHENGDEWLLMMTNTNNDPEAKHALEISGETFTWSGVHHLTKTN